MTVLFQILSILILAVFYGCYFTKMLLQKRKGIRTDQMGRGKQGLSRIIEIILKIITIILPLAQVTSIILTNPIIPPVLRFSGCLLALSGTVVFTISVVTMRDSWRAGVSESEKTELVTGGIYSISRNPAFLGFDLLDIGLLAVFFNLPLCILTVFGVIMFHMQITAVEEPFLIGVFGEDYLDYQKHVCRYLGRKHG